MSVKRRPTFFRNRPGFSSSLPCCSSSLLSGSHDDFSEGSIKRGSDELGRWESKPAQDCSRLPSSVTEDCVLVHDALTYEERWRQMYNFGVSSIAFSPAAHCESILKYLPVTFLHHRLAAGWPCLDRGLWIGSLGASFFVQ